MAASSPRLRFAFLALLALALALGLGGLAVGPSPRVAHAGDDAPKGFPEAWFGTWKGPARTLSPIGEVLAFEKQLVIGPTATPGRYTWTLIFDGAAGRQVRPYFLVATDAAKGMWTIDEENGISLTATFLDGALYTHFELAGHRIATRERLEGTGTPDAHMTTEIVTTVAGRETVLKAKDDRPPVSSWPIASLQTAVLRRVDATPALGAATDPDLERLATFMAGDFSSAAQASANAEYQPIRLSMTRIWLDRADGPWLYVEQALSTALDKPYRQRVYRLEHTGGDLFQSHVYALKEPAKAVGAGADPTKLAGVTPQTLEALAGCTVVLRRIDAATFRGSTLGSACENAFGGAAYATSEVTLTASGIRSWDRGYDAKAEQVWGATKGGYDFLRVDPSAPKPPAPTPPVAVPAPPLPTAPPSAPTPEKPPSK